MLNSVCTVLYAIEVRDGKKNCLRKQLCRSYSDSLKIFTLYCKKNEEQKFKVQRNGETGHFSDPALMS